jgi:hypothetical protein
MSNASNRNPQIYNYHSYLVRIWRDKPHGGWRASAQSVQSGETVLFGDVESLLTFLQSETLGKHGAGAAEESAQ